MTFSFESKDDIRNRCVSYLLALLAKHEPFVQKLHEIASNHPKMVIEPLAEIQEIMTMKYITSSEKKTSEDARLYYGKLLAIVTEYGLNPYWALERIHRAAKSLDVLFTGMNLADIPVEKKYAIEWSFDVESLPTKNQIETDILRQFKQQWKELSGELRKYGFIRARRRSSLKDHLRWVFERVCLKQSWDKIAKSENAHPDTIRHSVDPIIRQLGLSPPKIPGGKPHK